MPEVERDSETDRGSDDSLIVVVVVELAVGLLSVIKLGTTLRPSSESPPSLAVRVGCLPRARRGRELARYLDDTAPPAVLAAADRPGEADVGLPRHLGYGLELEGAVQ
eukprot:5693645-Pyramimonas_sp.AAC.1